MKSSRVSTSTGRALSRMMVDGSAVNVKPFVSTASPGRTPAVTIMSRIADEHELTPTAYCMPTSSANSFSAMATCDVSADGAQ